MNYLEQAKELKAEIEDLQYPDSMGNFKEGNLDVIKKQAKELKEKIEKGCGVYLLPVGSHNECGQLKRSLNAMLGEEEDILYCEDCQEAKKICEEILK